MKTVYDLSALDGVLKTVLPRDYTEIEAKIKEQVKKTVSAAFRECYVILPVSGNQYDAYAFAAHLLIKNVETDQGHIHG